MTRYTGPIRRVDTAKGHHYVDANKHHVPGVTTITGALPKDALINWAANTTAGYTIDHWDTLAAMAPSERLKKLQGARYEDKDRAANRGTEVHKLAEKLVTGAEVNIPEELAGHAESYVHFLDEFDPQPVLVECVVFSHKHGYAGTLDLVADFPTLGKRLLCDVKTNRSGIFGETAVQLAGYRYAETYLDGEGVEQPMLEVDGCAAIHVRADGFDLIPVTAGPQQHRVLLYLQQVRQFDQDSRDFVGSPIPPPSRVQRRRLEIVERLETVS
ncbi:MAG: hypothetical protein ACRDTZ_01105 [Pseudonocardiaceae bacterium]